ncbi:MAG: carbohydrate ABC transporter permease [Cellulosilyticaceae bacterium]
MHNKFFQKEAFKAWCFLLPGLILLCIFVCYPIIYSVPLAFTNYSVIQETQFVGFDNFRRILKDPQFTVSMINSLKYIITVPIIQCLALLVAILLNSKIKGIKFFRVAYYIPVVTSMVAVSIMWSWLLSQDGLINYILINLGIIDQKVSWLTNGSTALYTLMFITIWKGIGYYMVIYLAGLQSVPQEIQEASLVDGANKWQQITRITLPMLKPYILYCSVLSLMSAIKVFDEVFVLTKGGPGVTTMTASYFIYKRGFEYFEFGYAAAGGLILSVVVLILSIITFKLNAKGGMNPYGD